MRRGLQRPGLEARDGPGPALPRRAGSHFARLARRPQQGDNLFALEVKLQQLAANADQPVMLGEGLARKLGLTVSWGAQSQENGVIEQDRRAVPRVRRRRAFSALRDQSA